MINILKKIQSMESIEVLLSYTCLFTIDHNYRYRLWTSLKYYYYYSMCIYICIVVSTHVRILILISGWKWSETNKSVFFNNANQFLNILYRVCVSLNYLSESYYSLFYALQLFIKLYLFMAYYYIDYISIYLSWVF